MAKAWNIGEAGSVGEEVQYLDTKLSTIAWINESERQVRAPGPEDSTRAGTSGSARRAAAALQSDGPEDSKRITSIHQFERHGTEAATDAGVWSIGGAPGSGAAEGAYMKVVPQRTSKHGGDFSLAP